MQPATLTQHLDAAGIPYVCRGDRIHVRDVVITCAPEGVRVVTPHVTCEDASVITVIQLARGATTTPAVPR